jgi:excisionase family DNA binding protein
MSRILPLSGDEPEISIRGAARLLGVHHSTILRFIVKGQLSARDIAGRLILDRSDVLRVQHAIEAARATQSSNLEAAHSA